MRTRAILVLLLAITGLLATNRAHIGHRVVFRAAPSASAIAGRRLAAAGIVTPRVAGVPAERRIIVPEQRREEGVRGEVVHGFVGAPNFGWPYYPDYVDFPQRGSDASRPEVIVISRTQSDAPPPEAPAAAVHVYYGYAPGCHAIPNGYHCDPPKTEDGTH